MNKLYADMAALGWEPMNGEAEHGWIYVGGVFFQGIVK